MVEDGFIPCYVAPEYIFNREEVLAVVAFRYRTLVQLA